MTMGGTDTPGGTVLTHSRDDCQQLQPPFWSWYRLFQQSEDRLPQAGRRIPGSLRIYACGAPLSHPFCIIALNKIHLV